MPGWTLLSLESYVTPREMDRLWGRILRPVFLKNNLVNLSYNALLGKISTSGRFNLKLLRTVTLDKFFMNFKTHYNTGIKSRLWLFQRSCKRKKVNELNPSLSRWIMSMANWHLPWVLAIYIYKVKPCAAAGSWPSKPLKGFQGGEQKWVLCVWGKSWQDRSSDEYSQGLIWWAQFLYLFI